jgi:hypothetical protein
MVERKLTLLDAMVLLAALAVGLALTSTPLQALALEFSHVIQVARGDVKLSGKTGYELVCDPDIAWVSNNGMGCSLRKRTIYDLAVDPWLACSFSEGGGQSLDFSRLPGTPSLWWVLFDSSGPRLARRIGIHAFEAWPLLVIWGVAVLSLRLRTCRPRWRDLLSQPGLWACLTPIVTLLTLPAIGVYLNLRLSPLLLPGTVAVAWLALVLSRQWYTDPSWGDRTGRAIGLCWLLLLVIGLWTET